MQPSPQRKATDREDRRIVPGDLPQLFVALGIFADAVVSGFTGFAFSAVAVAAVTRIPGIAALFKRLSLRQRFLVEPLLGLLLLGLLTAAFLFELHHQNALLKRVAEQNIAAYDRYSEVFVNLSEQHLALHELLRNTRKLDEESLYDGATQSLNRIHRAVRDLEQALPAPTDGGERLAVKRSELLGSTQAYRNAATSAVTMATVNLALAPGQRCGEVERKPPSAKLEAIA